MQAAKANTLAWAELAPPTRVVLGRAAGPSVVLVVEPVWATALGELPHAANSTVMAPTAHTIRSVRGRRRLGALLADGPSSSQGFASFGSRRAPLERLG